MNQTPSDTLKILKSLAKEEAGITDLPSGNIQESLDSVERMSLMVAIEDHFLIMFEPEEESEIQSIDDLIAMIRRKVDGQVTHA